MKTCTGKPGENKGQPAANTVAQGQRYSGTAIQLIDNRPETSRMQHQQQMVNSSARVKQSGVYQAMADNYTSATAQQKVIQRKIGHGGVLYRGWKVVDRSGNKFEIVNDHIFLGRLKYVLEDEGGSQKWVDFEDDNYELDGKYKGIEEFTDWQLLQTGSKRKRLSDPRGAADKNTEEGNTAVVKKKRTKTSLKFVIARRDGSARTNTTFSDKTLAIQVLTEECGLGKKLATSLIQKKDWSYPTMRSLMEILQEMGTLQPGLGEGAKLWRDKQKVGRYEVETTQNGSQLAQIVGCHLMEYQETNSGTQGPRQKNDLSRQKQLDLSEAILQLPAEQAPEHTLGLGLEDHVKLFPALFDVKFEDNENKLFSKTAGSLTFKLYQSAIKARNQQYDHTDTLTDAARKDRKIKLKRELARKKFEVDSLDKFKKKDEDYLHTYLGLKDTESDNSLDEAEEWESPFTVEKVGKWTLKEFYAQVYKQNVYSGVLLKESAAKLAELDVLESKPQQRPVREKASNSRRRRRRVQSRVKAVNDVLLQVMRDLNINVVKLYERLSQWQNKKKALDSIKTTDKDNLQEITELKASLNEYMQMKLSDLQPLDYPPPLQGIGEKKFEELGWVKPAVKKKVRTKTNL